jgi:hypothetical protein
MRFIIPVIGVGTIEFEKRCDCDFQTPNIVMKRTVDRGQSEADRIKGVSCPECSRWYKRIDKGM